MLLLARLYTHLQQTSKSISLKEDRSVQSSQVKSEKLENNQQANINDFVATFGLFEMQRWLDN